MKLVDKNQREFVIDKVSSLFDMASTFSWMENSEDETLINSREVEVLDAEGNAIERLSLTDSLASGQSIVLDVTFEATHSGRNRNFFNYNSEDLERGASSWKSPFSKPLLKNHDMYTEPLGRVRDFSFGPSIITDERDAVTVTFRVTDQDAVAKFLDGRYQTMSIGASCGHVTCNICGKDILKDEEFKFCGHMRGQKYKGEMAYWTAKDFEFKEGSVVNNPADDFAQVIRVQVVKNNESHSANDEEENETVVQDEASNALIITDSESSIIDDLLNEDEQETTHVEDQDHSSEEEEESDEVNDQEDESSTELTIEDLQEQIQTLQSTIDSQTETLKAKDEELEAIQATLAAKDEEVATIQQSAKAIEDSLRQQNLALAVANKRLLVDMALEVESRHHTLTDDAKEQRRQELSAMKASELADLLKDHAEKAQLSRRTLPPKVSNPGIVDNEKEKNVMPTDKSKREDKEESVNQPTMKDLTDAFVGLFTRQC